LEEVAGAVRYSLEPFDRGVGQEIIARMIRSTAERHKSPGYPSHAPWEGVASHRPVQAGRSSISSVRAYDTFAFLEHTLQLCLPTEQRGVRDLPIFRYGDDGFELEHGHLYSVYFDLGSLAVATFVFS
jgi:hypothetical protein